MSGITDKDGVGIFANQKRILFRMDCFTEVGTTGSCCTQTRRIDAVDLPSGNSIVTTPNDSVMTIYQHATYFQLGASGALG